MPRNAHRLENRIAARDGRLARHPAAPWPTSSPARARPCWSTMSATPQPPPRPWRHCTRPRPPRATRRGRTGRSRPTCRTRARSPACSPMSRPGRGRSTSWSTMPACRSRRRATASTEAAFARVIGVDLIGPALCSRAALAMFLRQTGTPGTIINTTSVHETIPKPGYAAYSVAKGGLGNLTRTLALEFAARGIRVNAVGAGRGGDRHERRLDGRPRGPPPPWKPISRWAAPPNPARSPRSSPSWPRTRPATSRARRSTPAAA